MGPEISFVITTYKRPQKLIRCLSSIRNFIKMECEIIVIDDAQNSESCDAAERFGVSYIKKKSNDRRGPARSRNIGIELSKGNFICFLDDDDFLLGNEINTMIYDANDSDLVCGNHLEFYQNDYGKNILKPVHIGDFNIEDMLIYNRLPIGSYIIKRKSIKYKFDEEMRSHEDWDFLLRNLFGLKIKYFDNFVVAIDKTENNTNSSMAKTREYFWLDFLSVYSRFPCPRLSSQRAALLNSFGVNVSPERLAAMPHINQRSY